MTTTQRRRPTATDRGRWLLARAAIVQVLPGSAALALGSLLVSVSGEGTVREALGAYWYLALMTCSTAAVLLWLTAELVDRRASRYALFTRDARARTAWSAVLAALGGAGVVGAVVVGPGGAGLGMFAAVFSGYVPLVLLVGLWLGGEPRAD